MTFSLSWKERNHFEKKTLIKLGLFFHETYVDLPIDQLFVSMQFLLSMKTSYKSTISKSLFEQSMTNCFIFRWITHFSFVILLKDCLSVEMMTIAHPGTECFTIVKQKWKILKTRNNAMRPEDQIWTRNKQSQSSRLMSWDYNQLEKIYLSVGFYYLHPIVPIVMFDHKDFE